MNVNTVLLMAVVGILIAAWMRSVDEGFEDAATDTDDIDPRDIPWRDSWSPADKYARNGHNCAIHTVEEGPNNTQIIVTSNSCEAGMAHTRPGNRIIIPDSIPLPMREETIQHELIHIMQRRDPDAWRQFYETQWSFTLNDKPPSDMPQSVIGARRSNPDTWETPWPCWHGRWWPVCVYKDPAAPNLRYATMVWWDATAKKLATSAPTEWVAFFGRPSQEEHPHELAAVYLTAGDTASEAGRRVINWWRSVAAARFHALS